MQCGVHVKKRSSDDKVIDVIFINDIQEEFEDVEETDHSENSNFQQCASFKEFWYSRLFSLGIFFIGCLCSVLFLGFFILASILALVLGGKKRHDALQKRYKLFRRSLVIILSSFVGIFSPRLGITLVTVYFSLFDVDTKIMDQIQKAMI